ncbi:MAG: iron-sulfur cluster assembly protein [Acidimicrobiales bacterium]
MTGPSTVDRIESALAAVTDPEYPGISIVDMGMVGAVSFSGGHARVELVPTFTGCPALAFIEADVIEAVTAIDEVRAATVDTAPSIVWDTSRLSPTAIETMARDLTVGVALPSRPTPCPRCHAHALVELSTFGPTRCRSIHRCRACDEIVEVLRA